MEVQERSKASRLLTTALRCSMEPSIMHKIAMEVWKDALVVIVLCSMLGPAAILELIFACFVW